MTQSRDQVNQEKQSDTQRKVREVITDLVGLGGLGLLSFGVWLVFGLGWSCIIGGAALFGLTLIGILRRREP